MSERRKRSLTRLLVITTVLAALVLAGCREAAGDEPTTSATASPDSASTNTVAADAGGTGAKATTDGTEQNTSAADAVGNLSAEEQDDAVDLAQAYLVGLTDFRSDQFDWSLEAAAQDNDGGWWARVSATPKDDTVLETIQIYMHKPVDFGMWVGHGMSPDIDPATDENMPEEVRGRLQRRPP